MNLPPGQKESSIFPRFGLPKYANRFPTEIDKISVTVGGDLKEFTVSDEDLDSLTSVPQISDFHCVTTWSKLNLHWRGYRFQEFYEKLILPKTSKEISFVVLKAQDGYKTSLPLMDLLAADVLLANQLDQQPLSVEHGAPIRLVVPAHYGYKNLKHLSHIGFYSEEQMLKKGLARFMDHPRARVAQEERARSGPAIIFRWLYKFGIQGTIKDFEKATAAYRAKGGD